MCKAVKEPHPVWWKQRRLWCTAILSFVALEATHRVLNDHRESSRDIQGNALLRVEVKHVATALATKDEEAKVDGTSKASHPLFGFYMMGDTPYSDWEEVMLGAQIANITSNRPDHTVFTIHVGDIQKVTRSNCERAYYKKIQRTLRQNALPTLIIPGDNDWYDCESREDSWNLFQEHFSGMEKYWYDRLPQGVPRMKIRRWESHPEYFVMQHEGILFVSIHLIHANPKNEPEGVFDERVRRSIEWVNRNVQDYFERYSIRGVILFGHSLRSPYTRPFFEGIVGSFINDTQKEDIPVLYLHGDGHDWRIDTKFSHQLHWKYYHDVQVDQGGLADPCLVEIAPQIDGKLVPLEKEHDNQFLFGKGLFRIDRQRGRYTGDILAQYGAPSSMVQAA